MTLKHGTFIETWHFYSVLIAKLNANSLGQFWLYKYQIIVPNKTHVSLLEANTRQNIQYGGKFITFETCL